MAKNNNPGRILKGTKATATLKGASGVWTLDEAMQLHRANAWPQPNLFQPVSNSLRLKGASPASYAIRSVARPGSATSGTISFWTKLGYSANDQHFFQSVDALGGSSSANRLYMAFGSTGTLYVYGLDGNANNTVYFITSQLFRDYGTWYHFVIIIDSTQATQANRFKLYANGVQVTAFSTATYPSQGAGIPFSLNATTFIGCNRGAGLSYAGEMAEFNYIDGYGVQPTLFGKFDTNNTWVPVAYTGSYGTNGFYLPFNNAVTSQTLGYDASLNGTAIYDADQDPYRGSVALHLTGNGPAGGNNNVFADSSVNNLAFTRNGSTTQGSFSPFALNTNAPYNPAVNGASAYFNGSSDYIYTASNALFNVGSNNVTVEAWVYLTAFNSTAPTISTIWSLDGSGTNNTFCYVYSSGSIAVGINGINEIASATGVIALNVWYHVAVVRNGSTTTVYVNGVSVASNTTSVWAQTGSRPFYVGSNPQSSGYYLTGYISNVRFLMNAVVYTAAFTPTNRPFGTLTNNLITFSEDFANSTWTKETTTITSSAAIAPDGTPSASLVTFTSNVGNYAQVYWGQTLTATVIYTFSVWLSGAPGTTVTILIFDGPTVDTLQVTLTSKLTRYSVTHTTAAVPTTGSANIQSRAGDTATYCYAWGAQIETASTPSNYTPTPANFKTAPSLLLNFANAAVADSAGANNITTVGSATITSASKYGSGALTFNGTSDRLEISGPSAQSSGSAGLYGLTPGLIPGTKDFTVEFWLNTRTGNDGYHRIVSSSNGAFSGGTFCMRHQPGSFVFATGNGTYGTTTYSIDFTLNTWTHVAYSRQGATGRGFINGRQVVTFGDTTNYNEAIQYVGSFYSAGAGEYFNGALDDVRITMGVARYTTDFTPPARALPEVGGKSFVTVNVNAGVVQRFTTTGTTSWTAPTDVTQVEVLVVAAGGTGASDGVTNVGNGGGGGGGLIYNTAYPVTPGQTYTVTVGAGQVGLSTAQQRNGGNSVFGNLVAIGGGGGGYYSNSPGATGGSGGGGGSASASGGAGTGGQGFAGGTASSNAGGGGGGAGGPATGTNSRDGGPGLQFGISGTPTYYAGGGGGSASSGAQGTGGSGGGGAAVSGGAGGVDGTANTGGGGGAQLASGTKGGNGGSGVVVIRYTTQAVGNTSDATTDNLVDSPTLYGHDTGAGGEVVGNYATLNPLVPNRNGSSYTFSNGNLTATNSTGWCIIPATIYTLGGKWYWEYTIHTSPYNILGFVYDNWVGSETSVSHLGYYSPLAGYGYAGHSQNYYYNSTTTSYGALFGAGDIIGVALDMIAGTLTFYKNGASQGTITGIDTTKRFAPAISLYTSSASINLGQRAWAYTPPAGFNALTTKNLPRATNAAATPNQFFDIVTYTGTGATQSITGLNFQPDLVWIKNRSTASYGHKWYDVIRGAHTQLETNDTGAETAGASNSLASFNSNGFTLGAYAGTNGSTNNLVAWCWKAGGAPVSNTSGTITSQVSANTASGFSIVTWTGSANGVGTMGHGLGTAPKLIITKQRNQTGAWYTYTTAIDGTNKYLLFNTTATAGSTGVALPTSTVFSNDSWTATYNMIAYCWAEVAGFSKIGTWNNNNANDGTFVYTGFKPAMILLKNTDNAEHWYIVDSKRPGYNVAAGSVLGLSPNLASAEPSGFTSTATIDFVSNGFKIRTSNPASGEISFGTRNYIYMVFAEAPFGNVNGTAR